MRLIHAETLALSEFFGTNIPRYAILSHTWGDEEVTFQDWADLDKASRKKGFAKIKGACAKAREHRLEWVWVDTNCIDKTSSAELTEAINSMFQWYAASQICYAYLSDVKSANEPDDDVFLSSIRRSRWFTRGWTLQELLAPEVLTFYARDWTKLGTRDASMAGIIAEITGIDTEFLSMGSKFVVQRAPVAKKMSWLARRTTTRIEDMAYCMLGLFDINMPLLYGEGIKAFNRLQNEIIKVSNDHTIFCWLWTPDVPDDWTSLLAYSPAQFADTNVRGGELYGANDEISIYSMTNAGLSIRLPVLYTWDSFFILLKATPYHVQTDALIVLAIRVTGKRRGEVLHVSRERYPDRPVLLQVSPRTTYTLQGSEPLLVMNHPIYEAQDASYKNWRERNFRDVFSGPNPKLITVFDSEKLRANWGLSWGATWSSDNDTVAASLNKLARSSKAEVRAAMLGRNSVPLRNTKHKVTICIFVAIKKYHGLDPVHAYCQIFLSPWELDDWKSKEYDVAERPKRIVEPLLRKLSKRALKAEWTQTAHYSEDLGISIMLDTSQMTLQQRPAIAFLRFSERRTAFEGFRTGPGPPGKSQLGDDTESSVDSNAADAHFIPGELVTVTSQGQFKAPELENDWVDWKKKTGYKLKSNS